MIKENRTRLGMSDPCIAHHSKDEVSLVRQDTVRRRVEAAATQEQLDVDSDDESRLRWAEASTSFDSRYVWGETIGVGSSSAVRVVVDRATGEEWACKMISDPVEREAASAEIDLLRQLSHCRNVVKYREHFCTRDALLIITELLRGPDLHTELVNHGGPFNEKRARGVMVQLLRALSDIHKLGVVHRDVKPENIVLVDQGEASPPLVKLVDFGLAGRITVENPYLSDRCGTPLYVAPEVFAARHPDGGSSAYGTLVDVWSAGVVFYALLSMDCPFYGESISELLNAIRVWEPSYENPVWQTVSAESKGLVKRMLMKNPRRRPTANELQEEMVACC